MEKRKIPAIPLPRAQTDRLLHRALLDHRIRNLAEAGDISTQNEIARFPEFGRRFADRDIDIRHDLPQPAIHLFEAPLMHAGVLTHLELRGSDAAGVCGLSRPES